jgi:hypothetical protein
MVGTRIDRTLIVVLFASIIFSTSIRIWHSRAVEPALREYQTGDAFADLEGVDFHRNSLTLVLWVDSRCSPCISSTDFYRRLAAHPRQYRVLIVGERDSYAELQQFDKRYSIDADRVISLSRGHLVRLGPTPRVVLVDRNGLVRHRWDGLLETSVQSQILSELTSTTSSTH